MQHETVLYSDLIAFHQRLRVNNQRLVRAKPFKTGGEDFFHMMFLEQR